VGRPAWKRALRREIASAEKIVVLGIGHPDQGDDAAGILAAKELRKVLGRRGRSGVKVLLGYETPENLTGEIRKFSPRLVIMLDAAIGPHLPGTVFAVEAEDIPDEGISTHKISLRMLVAYLESTIGCRVRFLGVQPGRIELGRALTPAAERAARTLACWLGKALEKKSGS
jgi:hydrogenase maturation protease